MSQRKIREAVQKMAGTWLKDYATFIDCEVVSVDEDNRLCDCVAIGGDSDFEIPSVQLMTEPNDGQLIIPKVGSAVRVGISQRNEPFVVMFSEIEKVIMVSGLYQFNDGTFGGLTKIEVLTEKINNLENKVNDLISSYNAHVHTGVQTGAGSSGTTPSVITGSLTPTQRYELENTLITHGE